MLRNIIILISLYFLLSHSKILLDGIYTSPNTFEINYTSEISTSYIYIDLQYNSLEIPLLSSKFGISPNIIWNPSNSSWNSDADYIDWNSWILNKTYGHLLIKPQNSTNSKILYITVSYKSNSGVQYHLNITNYSNIQIDTPICPNSCSHNGNCNSGQCSCNYGFGDDDCSVGLTDLQLETAYGIITINQYKYMEIKDVDGDYLKCQLFKSDNGNVSVYFKNSGTGVSSLPTAKDYSEICQLKYAMDHETCTFSLNEYDSDIWLISVILHLKDSSAMISIACSSQGKQPPVSVLFWVLLSLSILLITIGIGLLIIRKMRTRKNQIIPAFEPKPRQPDPNERQKLQENYPCVSFEDLKLVNEEKCSICQESFIFSSKVRKLGCLHVFHQCCIDVWFDTSPLCPLCKKDYKAYLDQCERTHTDISGISIMNLDVSERTWLTQ